MCEVKEFLKALRLNPEAMPDCEMSFEIHF